MDDGKVVPLRANMKPDDMPDEPNEDVVAFAEDILARAKSGDIRTLCASLYHTDNSFSYRCAGTVSIGSIGNIERMKNYVCRRLDDEE